MTVRHGLRRGVAVVAVCGVFGGAGVGTAAADPEVVEPVVAEAPAVPPPPEGAPPPPDPALVPSSPAATTTSPDGWTLTLSARDETQLVIPPLTTAISTREYEVGGIFSASMTGPEEAEPPRGSLEVGYQIGCGIDMSTSNGVTLSGNIGLTPGLVLAGAGAVPTALTPIGGGLTVALKPGIINTVPVSKKEFEGAEPWVMVDGFRIKIDGCVGESFIRSYAFLTRSTPVSDAVLAWYGVTKKV
ncbi:MspA family porin [Mycobacterium deserti]|uniref:MspA family porin n=1 Tax=Mycobacterium deserti TaxID=2978347 RepID=A0ABT2MIN1_9MYCO|nr:MspA family porin [Mycobacterium deserti]MCT7662144.1 MspA family porin [Mycobacterium deserti]